MFKYLLTFTICFSIADAAFCQKQDTAVLYYSYRHGTVVRVSTLAEADYFRMILPPDPGDDHRNVREFYKNGKAKLITKLSTDYLISDFDHFDGDFISFYPDGKKLSIAHYTNGNIDGLEYRFYPNGRLYCTVKHQAMGRRILYWECYDTLSKQICNEGTGKFINHLENHGYPDITMEGQVMNGYAEGEWKGSTMTMFNFRFNAQYKKGKLISAFGYDQRGNSYPFKNEIQREEYKTGTGRFIEEVRQNIKLPKDTNGKKISIDDLHLRFIVEKDGHISHPGIIERKDPVLQKAVIAALKKCDYWSPALILGLPVRVEVVVPLISINRGDAGMPSSIRIMYRIWYFDRVLTDEEL